MNEEKKKELIEDLNRNYITFLSYGKEDFIPAGEFIVKDIVTDDAVVEYLDLHNMKKNTQVVLVKKDDETFQITIPLKIFINDFSKIAYENAKEWGTGADFMKDPQKVANKETDYITSVDIDYALLKKAKGLYLEDYEEIDAKSSIGLDLSNYSICPVDLGMWRELIKEKVYTRRPQKQLEEQKENEEPYR